MQVSQSDASSQKLRSYKLFKCAHTKSALGYAMDTCDNFGNCQQSSHDWDRSLKKKIIVDDHDDDVIFLKEIPALNLDFSPLGSPDNPLTTRKP